MESEMSLIWAIIAVLVIALILYGLISSKLTERRKRKAREKALPYVADTIRVGTKYDVQMSDGRRFESVEIIGTNNPQDGQFPLGGWDGLLVLRLDSGKKAYVRQSSVRCVIEQ